MFGLLPLSIFSYLRFEEPDKPGGAPDPEPKKDGADDDDVVTFKQRELQSLFAAESDKGKRKGRRELEEKLQSELGAPLSEVKAMIQAQKEREDSEKSEAQKAREAADAEKAAAEKERKEAARDRHEVKVERALLKAGLSPERVDRIALMVDVEVGAEAEDIEDAVKKTKEEFPEVFTAANGMKPTDSDYRAPKPKRTAPSTAYESGQQRAKQFNPKVDA